MSYTPEQLRKIFNKTDGVCHICHGDEGVIYFNNYGKPGARGAWEVDHSLAQANGGTDHLNNLFPAHVACNRRRQDTSIQKCRAERGHNAPPISPHTKDVVKKERTGFGGLGGAVVGFTVGGPVGAVIGGITGAMVGHELNPRRKTKN